MKIDRRAFVTSLGGPAAISLMTPDDKADALEHYLEDRLKEADVLEGILKEAQVGQYPTVSELQARNADLDRPYRNGAGTLFVPKNDGDRKVDGRLRPLTPMPEKPTLLDFFKYRFAWTGHCLQSATRALKTGMREEVILACLLHDVILSVMHPDHGWWGGNCSNLTCQKSPASPSVTIRCCDSIPTKPLTTYIRKVISVCLVRTTSQSRTWSAPTSLCEITSGMSIRVW